jgi:hypothetical protein
MTSTKGTPEGLKRTYHTPVVQEFGSVSETTATFDDFNIEDQIPSWYEVPPGGTPGGGLS